MSAAQTFQAVGAVEMLKEDHRRVSELFDEFDAAEVVHRKSIGEAVIKELVAHTQLEEKIFYPAVREAIGASELVEEAEQAHHVIKFLITELRLMPAGERYNAKFSIMAKNVRQHIRDEEDEIFPRVEQAGIDLDNLGKEMQELKDTLLARRPMGPALLFAGAALAAGGLLLRSSLKKKSRRKILTFK